MLAESENFSDGEEDEEVEDEVAHAEKLAKEKWVVEDQCKWTIFEDPADELRYHRRRSRALGYFVRAFRYFREESERLHEAGAGLQDAYERLQEENKEAIGDAAYWRELAEARAEQSTVGSAIIREPPPSLDTAGNDETSSRISLAQSEPATVDCSVERFESAEITMRFDVASSSAGEEELVPSEVRPSLRRKSMPAASASDLEPPQTCEAWESQSTMISALSTVREEATRWRKVAEQRGEELLSLRQQYNALSSPGSASCSPGARSWHRHSTTTSTAGGTSAVSSVAAASSQCSQKRRSCGPGSTPPPSFRTLPGTAAMGACVGNVGGRDGASPRRQGAPKSAPSSPKPGAAAFRQVQAPGLATHTTRASSPRREVVHEQDRAAGEQVSLNQHEQEQSEPCGSPRVRSWCGIKNLGAAPATGTATSGSAEPLPTVRQISFSPSPRRDNITNGWDASGEEEMQIEKLASISNSEATSAAPTSSLLRGVPTPARSSAPAKRLLGLGNPVRRKDAAAVPPASSAAWPSAALAAATTAQAESARALSRLSEPRTSRASITGPPEPRTSRTSITGPSPSESSSSKSTKSSGGRRSLALGAPTRKSLAGRSACISANGDVVRQDSPRLSSRKSLSGPDPSAVLSNVLGEPNEEPSTKKTVTDLVDVWENRQRDPRPRLRPNSADRKHCPPSTEQGAGVDASS
mmetsp:Transcript_88731/g.162637  ORF Transcript_88731/g.162637 Transcript_88731/m.162637 type:complete len:697 (+) Transcript_88731:138-2228(+)